MLCNDDAGEPGDHRSSITSDNPYLCPDTLMTKLTLLSSAKEDYWGGM